MPGRRYIESDRIEGTAVYDVNGHHVGSVRRLIVEKATGQVAYLVINFFGIGEDNHAVPWGKFTYDVNAGGYRTDITEEVLRRAPEFSQGEDPGAVHPDREQELYAYYNIPPANRAL